VDSAPELGGFITSNHLSRRPIWINDLAAAVLRLADGERSLQEVVLGVVDRSSGSESEILARRRVVELLRRLTDCNLVWWRDRPLVSQEVPPPARVSWELTAACNLGCPHCMVRTDGGRENELPTWRCLEIVDQLAACGVSQLVITGGEPLLRMDLREIVEQVRERGLEVLLATNGTLVSREVARWLRKLDVEVQVGLDGSCAEIHDQMRPGVNSFARAVSGIQALVEQGHAVTIGTLLSAINVDDIPAIIRLASRLEVARFKLNPFVPAGPGLSLADLEVPPERVRQTVRFLRRLRPTTSIEIAACANEEALGGEGLVEPAEPGRRLGCAGAVSHAAITPVGELLPCRFFTGVRVERLENGSFVDVWQHSRFLRFFRSLTVADLHGACTTCFWLARCGGGCRAASFYRGDPLGTNPQCWVPLGLDDRDRHSARGLDRRGGPASDAASLDESSLPIN
jgi:radical SAM protein with 4Fe4S-binding SPASM domain